jgi:hypothetical protein
MKQEGVRSLTGYILKQGVEFVQQSLGNKERNKENQSKN